LIDKNGNLLKCQKKSDLDPELLSSMAGNIYRSTVRVVDKFNTGDFVYGMVMCQNSHLYIVGVRWAVLVLETGLDVNQEVLEKKIHQYLGELDL
jgi:predicted regulator of Ras-like GTPase activity (Roadblock/LC7/MglB family)